MLTGIMTDAMGLQIADAVLQQLSLRLRLNPLSVKRRGKSYLGFGDAVAIILLHYLCDDLGRAWQNIKELAALMPREMLSSSGEAEYENINRSVLEDTLSRISILGLGAFFSECNPVALQHLDQVSIVLNRLQQLEEEQDTAAEGAGASRFSEDELAFVRSIVFPQFNGTTETDRQQLEHYISFFTAREQELRALVLHCDYLPQVMGSHSVDAIVADLRRQSSDKVALLATKTNGRLGGPSQLVNPRYVEMLSPEEIKAAITNPKIKEVNNLKIALEWQEAMLICENAGLHTIMRLPDDAPIVQKIKKHIEHNEIRFQTFQSTSNIASYEEALANEKVLPLYPIKGAFLGTFKVNVKHHTTITPSGKGAAATATAAATPAAAGVDRATAGGAAAAPTEEQELEVSLLAISAESLRDTLTMHMKKLAQIELNRIQVLNYLYFDSSVSDEEIWSYLEQRYSSSQWCNYNIYKIENQQQYRRRGRPRQDASPECARRTAYVEFDIDPGKIERAVSNELNYVLAISHRQAELTMKNYYDIFNIELTQVTSVSSTRKSGRVSSQMLQNSSRRLTAATALTHYALLLNKIIQKRLEVTRLAARYLPELFR